MASTLDHLRSALLNQVDLGRSAFLFGKACSNPRAVAAGLATLLPGTTHVVNARGEYLNAEESGRLIEWLSAGQNTVLLSTEVSDFPVQFVDEWQQYNDEHISSPLWTSGLNPDLAHSGFLAVLHLPPDTRGWAQRAHSIAVADEETAELAQLGSAREDYVIDLGVEMVTIEALCRLHERDQPGTPDHKMHELVSLIESPTAYQLTWTDLQLLLQAGSYEDDGYAALHRLGILDDEKQRYALAARYFLRRRRLTRVPRPLAIWDSIYDVVWDLVRLEWQGDIFRGQFGTQWPLEPTLLRARSESQPLDLQLMQDRVTVTEAFLAALRKRRDLAKLSDDELIAVAQHFEFATPLLDFTESLKVAAWFASRRAAREECDGAIGIIYHLGKDIDELMNADPGSELGLNLKDLTGIRVGRVSRIKPPLPQVDNRIARQKAVFVAGFHGPHLQEVVIDRIPFRQRTGVVFTDPRRGIDGEHLLPENTGLSELADEVRKRFSHSSPPRLNRTLGTVLLPRPSIVGSEGSQLYSQLAEGGQFMEHLASLAADPADKASLRDICTRFFQAARFSADVGAAPQADDLGLKPIALAVAELADWFGLPEPALWETIHFELCDRGEEAGAEPSPLELQSRRHRLALACAYYLAGWQCLSHVNGSGARDLTLRAGAVLRGLWPRPPNGGWLFKELTEP